MAQTQETAPRRGPTDCARLNLGLSPSSLSGSRPRERRPVAGQTEPGRAFGRRRVGFRTTHASTTYVQRLNERPVLCALFTPLIHTTLNPFISCL